MQSNSQTIEFTSETTSNGVIERHFVVDDITGVLWSLASGSVESPLLLSGHSGGMHKKAPGLVASALHSVSSHGFTVAAIDAPGHGDRPRNTQDEQWVEAIHQARAAHEPIAPIVVEYNRSLAERAVPEWQATIDALQTLPDVDADAPIGFGGVSLGVVTGLMLAPVESRIAAVSFGGVLWTAPSSRQHESSRSRSSTGSLGTTRITTARQGWRCSMPSARRRRRCTPTRAGTIRCPTTSETVRLGSSPATSAGAVALL